VLLLQGNCTLQRLLQPHPTYCLSSSSSSSSNSNSMVICAAGAILRPPGALDLFWCCGLADLKHM
jgi:hypothetical protein